jgi:hypothetical protein
VVGFQEMGLGNKFSMEVDEKVPNKPSFNLIFFFNWIKFVVVALLIHGYQRERGVFFAAVGML